MQLRPRWWKCSNTDGNWNKRWEGFKKAELMLQDENLPLKIQKLRGTGVRLNSLKGSCLNLEMPRLWSLHYWWAPNHFQHYWGRWQKPVETIFFTKNNARSALGGTGADHGKWKWERDSCCEADCCRELSWKNADSDVVLANKRLEDDAWLVRCRPRRWRGRHVILLHTLKLLLPTSLQKFLQSTSSMWSFQDQGPWWAC